METLTGRRACPMDAAALRRRTAVYCDMLVDLGTGDGRFVCAHARSHPAGFAIGIDACRENLRVASRAAPPNALFVIACAEALPAELHGLAGRVTLNFPWGSLLTGLLRRDAGLLAGLAAVAQPDAGLELRLNAGALAEAGLALEEGGIEASRALRAAGFRVAVPAFLDAAALRALPSTWARRLAFGRDPRALYLRARREE